MFRYRYIGEEPMCFVTIQRNVAPDEIIESHIPRDHPLLELVKEVEVPKSVKEPAVPDKEPSPVAVDELKEN